MCQGARCQGARCQGTFQNNSLYILTEPSWLLLCHLNSSCTPDVHYLQSSPSHLQGSLDTSCGQVLYTSTEPGNHQSPWQVSSGCPQRWFCCGLYKYLESLQELPGTSWDMATSSEGDYKQLGPRSLSFSLLPQSHNSHKRFHKGPHVTFHAHFLVPGIVFKDLI